ncbi:hypothetical protein P9847_06640 [Paenibacillus chibensis]|uniref:Lipoprotein n=1 Tax=Paenibacillus chibensis TaxID=59846 RepID=A0ABU6PQ27_9BACL|nr:hypothetical protein [Paenibacillus chibensis]MEC0373473.1 hypothetical protein [Paenibacillus chibensis]MED5016982.1 hypothetical protein [Paenibacillus chibensis]
MNKPFALLLACVLLIAAVGCDTHNVIKKETKLYNFDSYSEGNIRAQSQGKGLNGQLLNELQLTFGAKKIPLTHEMYAEDGRGNISYMFYIRGNPQQYINLHVFTDEQERIKRIHNWYGDQNRIDSQNMHTVIYSHNRASLIYTSSGKDKGIYDKQVHEVFNSLLNRMDFNQ